MARLKACEKALSDAYPAAAAIVAIFLSLYRRSRAAARIRHRATYSNGGTPTSSLKRAAKLERDIPALAAKSATVQSCAGF